jgi:2-(1,2-epoxy-1,2-dihydrophenyl)acetyl-CoA isomerase
MELKTLLLDKRDGVARVTLNRPEAANALDRTMARELMEVAIDCDEDRAVRCVVITGAGSRMFCAGGDLRAFVEAGEHGPALVKDMTTNLHAAVSRFARMNAPVIAAVNGTAAGGGFSLMCGCDLVIAVASASFTMAYTRAGLSPDGSSTFYLARLVGLRRAYEMALTNRVLSAAEALEWGLITRVVADADLPKEVDALAAQLAAGPTAAFGVTKRLLLDGSAETLETQMERESRGIASMLGHSDGQEGVKAFLAKRKPSFTGRP